MKTNVKNSENKVSKNEILATKIVSNEVEKKQVVKVVSNYKVNVIETNKALNVEKNSLGAYLDVLLKFKHLLPIEFQQVVIDIRVNNNKESYEALSKLVRVSSKGKFNQFYTLQGLQKFCFPKK